ncbi:ComF family protein [Rossellomorea marisflavi]|uniref:ComF family protein n=1 Tax=Rossellomorea marisflavi TaxID=189381 RepID=UPI0034599986
MKEELAMFVKTTEIKALIVYTSGITEQEYELLKDIKKDVFFLVSVNDIVPSFIPDDVVIKESLEDYTYGTTVKSVVNKIFISSNNLVFISKNKALIKKILHQPVGTILIDENLSQYEDIGFLPDCKFPNAIKLVDSLNLKIGYFSELMSTLVLEKAFNTSGMFFTFIMERENIRVKIVAGGRYFGSSHNLFNVHQLSRRVNISKSHDSQNDIFVSILEPLVNKVIETSKSRLNDDDSNLYGVTRVPSRPNKDDRFKPIVEAISKNLCISDLSSVLTCPEDYPSHKSLGKEKRFENVAGKFKVIDKEMVENKHIILLDDVFTTGATVFECAKELYKNGASVVEVVVLAVNQYTRDYFSHKNMDCPRCDQPMVMKINTNTNSAFFGHQDYKTNSCRNTEHFLPGLNHYNKKNAIVPLEEEDTVLF